MPQPRLLVPDRCDPLARSLRVDDQYEQGLQYTVGIHFYGYTVVVACYRQSTVLDTRDTSSYMNISLTYSLMPR